ncbi:Arc family DNA-binding protein [Pectinatus frisingensis]|uniref:Arc family DNA-binding protein n=1 Tax=Pectinatus frisingensis TaxID=865 RepID=UPI0015F570E3|nr:Arc family DNA-binding protein [Pectinatus frisingensis]
MATDKRQFTLRLQDENFQKVKRIAEKERRSIAMEIEFIIEQYIAKFEKENGKIQLTKE